MKCNNLIISIVSACFNKNTFAQSFSLNCFIVISLQGRPNEAFYFVDRSVLYSEKVIFLFIIRFFLYGRLFLLALNKSILLCGLFFIDSLHNHKYSWCNGF